MSKLLSVGDGVNDLVSRSSNSSKTSFCLVGPAGVLSVAYEKKLDIGLHGGVLHGDDDFGYDSTSEKLDFLSLFLQGSVLNFLALRPHSLNLILIKLFLKIQLNLKQIQITYWNLH